jgi:ketopantoate reductase PanE/ApbA-like protein
MYSRNRTEVQVTHRVLILGASYGSLFGTKLLMAGHRVTLVCTRDTAELINREGTRVRFPVKGRDAPLEVDSRTLPGALSALTPEEADPRDFDLVVLGMQEAHYGARGVRELMRRVARSRKPCLAIMNMPPLPYLKRIPRLSTRSLRACYADPRVWKGFDPALVTLASPDPQAFRPADCPKNVLQVGLPTNFKAARFESEAPTALLRELEAGIEAARLPSGEEIPVKLKVHDSIFVPLAKWPMLIAGNYRCIRQDDMIPIREAVHGDVDESRRIYDWVAGLCTGLGAESADLVPFEKYAKAAETLVKPSSAARALFGGAEHIERVDGLVRRIARQRGLQCDALHEIVTRVDERLRRNRSVAQRPFFATSAALAT